MAGETDRTSRLIIISAASGTGKTTLVKALCDSDPRLTVSISYTTRPSRGREADGEDYFFVDAARFKHMVDERQFLEYASVFNYSYGTSRDWVNSQLCCGRDVILEIDWQGAEQVRQVMPDCVSIFILPPSCKVLANRLFNRRQDAPDIIRQRMRAVAEEFSHYSEYDFAFINDEFTAALSTLSGIISSVRARQISQQEDLRQFVSDLIAEAESFR